MKPSSSNAPEISTQFSRFASSYDEFMHKYVNYRSWVQYVRRIFARNRYRPKSLLDLACGTGIPTLMLAEYGYRIFAVDRSEAMLAVLRSKLKPRKYDVRPIQADMRDFDLPEPADAAISLYDSINYLLTPEDLARCFQAVYRNLQPNGLFVFDMNTVYGLATYWADQTSVRETGDIYSIWQTSFDPDTRVSSLHLTFYVTEGRRRVRYDEIHEERGYHPDEIESGLRAAGFKQNDFYRHSTFDPPGEYATRIMIVARK